MGNVASRVLGLVRETVIAYLFGATGLVSVFRVAATIIQTLYDFLVGGMVSAALVPVFSDFAERREELWRVASIVLNVLAIFLALAVLLLELFAPQLVWLLGSGYDPELQLAAVDMLRLVLPAVFFLGMSGIVTGLLYSLKRFTYPAFTDRRLQRRYRRRCACARADVRHHESDHWHYYRRGIASGITTSRLARYALSLCYRF